MRSLIGSFIVLFGVFAAGCAAESTSSDDGDVQESTSTLFRADEVAAPFAEDAPRLPAAHSQLEAANENHDLPAAPSKLAAAREDHSMGGTTSVRKIGE